MNSFSSLYINCNLRLTQRYNLKDSARKFRILLDVGRDLKKNLECVGRRLTHCPNKNLKIMVPENIHWAWTVFQESCHYPDQQTGKVHLHFES